MSRSYIKYTKGGYRLNKNGVPVDNRGLPALNSSNPCRYHYKGTQKVGTYRPTPHNISDI